MRPIFLALVLAFPALATAANVPKGGTLLLSKGANGEAANADSRLPTMAPSGKTMAASTLASNLGPGTYNGFEQIIGYHRDGKSIGSISKMWGGNLANDNCGYSRLSKSGRFIAFESEANFGFPGVPGGYQQIFWRDTKTNDLKFASVGPSGAVPNAMAYVYDISDDGRFVLFWTRAGNLIPNDDNMTFRAYVRDMQQGMTELVSVTNTGLPFNDDMYRPKMSGDGRFVFFDSYAPNLGYGADTQVYVRDRLTKTTTLLSKNAAGLQGASNTQLLDVSRNGRFVVMNTDALDLVGPLLEGHIVLLDRVTGKLKALDVAMPGKTIYYAGLQTAISNDGKRLILSIDFKDSITNAHSVAICEYDLVTGKRWTASEIVGQSYHDAYLVFDASATAEWVVFVTESDLKESNGKLDAYLYRAH